jgi:capsular polysaccharide biosynthesis protein
MAPEALGVSTQGPDCDEGLMLAAAGSYTRAAPLLVDDAEAADDCRQAIARYHGVLRQSHAACAALALPDARIAGQGAVVTRSGALIAESVASFTAHGNVPDGLVAAGPSAYAMKPAARRIANPCLLAKRPWYRNYGHWLIDCASGIALASAARVTDGMSLVIGPYDHSPAMQRVVRDTITALGWQGEILVHPDDEVWAFDSLCYVTPLHIPPLFKLPDGLRALQRMLPVAPTTEPPRRRIFLSRGDKVPRRLLNENELLGLCVKHGFELVHPERLSLTEQAALFQSAAVVVGVKGAALTNAIFMSPGTAVIALSPGDFPDPFFWDIAAQLGVAYLEIIGGITTDRYRGLNDFTIQPNKLQAALALMEAAR